MCKVCTEAVHCVALWTRTLSQVWACVKYVQEQGVRGWLMGRVPTSTRQCYCFWMVLFIATCTGSLPTRQDAFKMKSAFLPCWILKVLRLFHWAMCSDRALQGGNRKSFKDPNEGLCRKPALKSIQWRHWIKTWKNYIHAKRLKINTAFACLSLLDIDFGKTPLQAAEPFRMRWPHLRCTRTSEPLNSSA